MAGVVEDSVLSPCRDVGAGVAVVTFASSASKTLRSLSLWHEARKGRAAQKAIPANLVIVFIICCFHCKYTHFFQDMFSDTAPDVC